jgi:D-arabinonate dehydratase
VNPSGSRISAVRSVVVSVPLPRPVAWSNVQVDRREYVLLWIEDTAGETGFGFTVGSRFPRGTAPIKSVVDEILAPILKGRDPTDIEALWEQMSFETLLLGRRGAATRAISAVDIALWDLLGKSVGRPLCDLFGRYRKSVPAYASGGYYYSEDVAEDLEGLEAEVRRHVDLGFRAVKIKIGRLSPRQEQTRVERVLQAVGPDVRVAVDANHAWRDPASAIVDLRRLDDLGLWWIEEPVLPDQLRASAKIAATLTTPIATGEIEGTRWGFERIVDADAADVLQPDATVVGGISEWLKVAGFAETCDLPLAPHWVPDIHVHLAAACKQVLALEYFHPEVGVLNFDQLVQEPLVVENGEVVVPDRPGHGIVLDMDAVARYEVT